MLVFSTLDRPSAVVVMRFFGLPKRASMPLLNSRLTAFLAL